MATLTYFAPAKLNRFLHITGRRADGYHELQTVFQLLDYGDELTFELRNDDQVILTTDKDMGEPEQNLIVKAARLLQKTTGMKHGANIHLSKRIPIGGGLGGGSSNAATTLLALNQLWQLGLSLDELAKLGLQLGADIPVFVHGQTAWAEGIGERLTPINLPTSWFLVLIPPCSVPTREIYLANELTRNTPAITIRDFLSGHPTHNDCEPVVRQRYPVIDSAISWLNQFAPAQLTGTGCCIFAELATEKESFTIMQQAQQKFQGFIAKGINSWGVAKR